MGTSKLQLPSQSSPIANQPLVINRGSGDRSPITEIDNRGSPGGYDVVLCPIDKRHPRPCNDVFTRLVYNSQVPAGSRLIDPPFPPLSTHRIHSIYHDMIINQSTWPIIFTSLGSIIIVFGLISDEVLDPYMVGWGFSHSPLRIC
jgi:hypothetical protein